MYKRYTLQDTLDSEKRNLFNVLSTFAGGGGSSTGYRLAGGCLLYTSPSPRDPKTSRMPSSA